MQESGAFTGEISANMIKDINVNWVLIGHSERRHKFGETNQMIAKKVKHAIDNKLNIIWCIGELLEERERNETLTIVDTQLSVVKDVISNDDWKNLVIAYEPVWAIGTGKNADTKTVYYSPRSAPVYSGMVDKKYFKVNF
ncbi:Triosephosphate isomerase, cytosolic [Intoshia linei]|uniref:Triosephosphate isomerase n=1 Tax=Intoshia linei TaxID=1819745 RepID=A0A177B719_9BILA|nr:Triosephosphate isomerase, cytosolic [Intoshia linei]